MSDNYISDLNDRVNDKLVELKKLRRDSKQFKGLPDYEYKV